MSQLRGVSALRAACVVLALLGAGACLALAWTSSILPFGRTYTDGERLLADRPELHERVVLNGPPQEWLGDLVDHRPPHSRVTFSPDGRLAVYAAPGSNDRLDLFSAERFGDTWMPRGPIVALNQPRSNEMSPVFDAKGALYFSSDRPGALGFDLFVASWDGQGFRDIYRITSEGVNGEWDDVDPWYDARSGYLYFASNRPRDPRREGEDFDLYRALFRLDGLIGDVEALPMLRSTKDERAPTMHPNGGRLLFASRRQGGSGGFDLYAAAPDYPDEKAPNKVFQPPRPLGEGINTKEDELDPGYLGQGFSFAFRRAPAPERERSGSAVETPAESLEAWPEPAEGAPGAPSPTRIWRVDSSELEALPTRWGIADFLLFAAALLLVALLAWLGHRWNALDLLTKALIIALLIHVLFMAWSRGIDVEDEIEEPEAPPPPSLLEVAFLPPEDSAMEMRGGAVERELEPTPLEPDTPRELELETDEAPVEPSFEPSEVALEQREAFEAELPEREAAAEREMTESELEEIAMQAAEAPSLETGETPELQPGEAVKTAAAEMELARDERAESETPVEQSTSESPSPSESAAAPARAAASLANAERPEATAEREASAAASFAEVALEEVAMPAHPELANPERTTSEELAEGPQELQPRDASEASNAATRSATTGPLNRAEDNPAPLLASSGGAAEALAPTRSRSTSEVQRPSRSANAPGSRSEVSPEVTMRSPLERFELGVEGESSPNPESSSDLLEDFGPASSASHPTRAALVQSQRRSTSSGSPAERSGESIAPSAIAALELPTGSRTSSIAAASSIPVRRTERRASGQPGSPEIPFPIPSAPRESTARTGSSEAERAASQPADLLGDLSPSATSTATRLASAKTASRPRRAAQPSSSLGDARMAAPLPGAAPPVQRRDVVRAGNAGRPSDLARRAPAAVDRRFERRFGDLKTRALEEGGGSKATEEAVLSGLRYLAQKQDGRGFWGDPRYKHAKYSFTIYGKSGLALLAFLGAGYTHRVESEFQDEVAKGIAFLLRAQDGPTGHFGACSSYGHAISTYALCEAYALTRDKALKEPLQRAVDWIIENQNRRSPGSREYGGWTYYYPDGHEYDPYARASITAWQVMALESARIGELEVAPGVLKAAEEFLKNCFDPGESWFRYNHRPFRLRSVYPTLPGSTPASLFALRLIGENVDSRLYESTWAGMLSKRPKNFKRPNEHTFVEEAAGNLYFWYYGSLAFFQRGGAEWRTWNQALKSVLLPAQQNDGSWRPISPYAETAGDTSGDRVYTTAMCVLMLEVYYRYFTPLLKKR